MKQALVEGAVPIAGIPMYEQGQGKLNLQNSMQILKAYQPKASIVPKALDFTDCPYMWPFCTQPIYANALPLIFNATVLNAMGLTGVSFLCFCLHQVPAALLPIYATALPLISSDTVLNAMGLTWVSHGLCDECIMCISCLQHGRLNLFGTRLSLC